MLLLCEMMLGGVRKLTRYRAHEQEKEDLQEITQVDTLIDDGRLWPKLKRKSKKISGNAYKQLGCYIGDTSTIWNRDRGSFHQSSLEMDSTLDRGSPVPVSQEMDCKLGRGSLTQ